MVRGLMGICFHQVATQTALLKESKMDNLTLKTNYSLILRRVTLTALVLIFCATVNPAIAADDASKLLVLDFELNDLTLNPDTTAEEKRVKTLRPLLSSKLSYDYDHRIMELAQDKRDAEVKGKGYIFDRPQVAAEMGASADAEWVVSGRLHKASFLFVYLKAQLIDVSSGRVESDFVVEIKGWEPRLTEKGVEALALQIDDSLKSLNNKLKNSE